MSKLASSTAALRLSITLGGLAVTGGCALVYHFDDYTGESSASAASGSGSGSAASSGSGGASGSSGSGSGGSSSISVGSGASTGSGGGGGGPRNLSPAWTRSFGTKGTDVNGSFGVAVTKGIQKEGLLIAGQFQGAIDLGTGILIPADDAVAVALLDSATGTTAWSFLVASSSVSTVNKPPAIAASPLGNVVVAVNYEGRAYLDDTQMSYKLTTGQSDIALYAIDVASHKIVWADSFGVAGDQIVRSIAVDAGGLIYITGSFVGNFTLGIMAPCALAHGMSALPDGFVAQLTPDGACNWATTWSSPTSVIGESGLSLAPLSDGVLVSGTYSDATTIGGFSLMGGVANQAFVAKVESDGNVSNASVITGAQDIALTVNPLGGAHFGATVGLASPSNIVVGDVSPKGQILTMVGYTTTGASRVRSIAHAPSGNVFITGWSTGTLNFGAPMQNYGKEDLFLAELTSMFQPVAVYELGDKDTQFGQSLGVDTSGNVYLGGDFEGNLSFYKNPVSAVSGLDVFIAKFDASNFNP